MKRPNNKSYKKRVKFNLKKNKTRRFNKRQQVLAVRNKNKTNKRKTSRKNMKKQNKSRNLRFNKKRKSMTKTKQMKGGAIPFSELGEVYDNIKYMANEAVAPFMDTPPPAVGNPDKPYDPPDVTKQFINTSRNEKLDVAPDIHAHYKNAFGSA